MEVNNKAKNYHRFRREFVHYDFLALRSVWSVMDQPVPVREKRHIEPAGRRGERQGWIAGLDDPKPQTAEEQDPLTLSAAQQPVVDVARGVDIDLQRLY